MVYGKKEFFICFSCVFVAFLILLLWLLPSTALFWDQLDTQAFYYFNGWLAKSRGAQLFWSIANFRPFDLLPVTIIVLSVTVRGVLIEQHNTREKTLLFFVLISMMFAIRYLVSFLYGDGRYSPSTTLSPAYLLTSLVTYLPSKDYALDSFPSDHAAVMLTWMCFMLIYAKKKYKLVSIPVALFFMLPRLVSGAHWITDIVVGSVFVTLLSVALVCYTPLGEHVVEMIQFITQKKTWRNLLVRKANA